MRGWLRGVSVVSAAGLIAGVLSVVGVAVTAGPAGAVGCPFGTDTPTECVVSAPVSPGAGPFTFNKTLHVTGTGSINANITGITLNIDGSAEAAGGAQGALLMDSNAAVIESNDNSSNGVSAGPITITTTGNVIMQAGSKITADNTFGNGGGGAINIGVNTSGTGVGTRMVLCGPSGSNDTNSTPTDPGCGGAHSLAGAVISASNIGGSTAPAGSITIQVNQAPVGEFLMGGSSGGFDGAKLLANTDHGLAGQIRVNAGQKIVVESGALVDSTAGSGDSSHGGPIFLISGCLTLIQGTVRSVGPDPGADLVHLEGCEVHVDGGQVYSQAHAHTGASGQCAQNGHNAVSAVCVEIWARHVTIDNGGQVWADFNDSGGINGTGWVDIYAQQDINIAGPAIGSPDSVGRYLPSSSFAVHSNGFLGDDVGGDITIKAKTSFITLSGRAVSSDDYGNNSNGGTITAEAAGPVTLDGSVLSANGDFAGNQSGGNCVVPSSGNCGDGGQIRVKSWSSTNGSLSWQNGVGDARPVNGSALIALQYCTTVNTSGTVFDNVLNNPAIVPTQLCDNTKPDIPAYVVFNPNFNWDKCGQSKVLGKKTDQNGAGLQGWTIDALDTGNNNAVVGTTTTDVNGNYSLNIPGGKNLLICEELQAGWTQTAPGPGTSCPPVPANLYGPNGYSVSTQNLSCCQGVTFEGKDFQNQLRFSPPTKSGFKFNDLNNNGIWDNPNQPNGEPGIGNWTIKLWTSPGGSLVSPTTTDTTAGATLGAYSFTIPAAGTYTVCEVLQTGWTQTAPTGAVGSAAPNPPGNGETIAGCNPDGSPNAQGPNRGYTFTIASGQTFANDNFGNHSTPVCPEDPNRAALMTRTVDTSKPAGGGSGTAGDPTNYLTLQAAYNAAKASPSTKDEVIGMFSKTTENVLLDNYTAKSMTITQCSSAQITAANSGYPAWKLTANKKLLIIGPDSVGGTIGWDLVTGGHELKSIRSNGATVAGLRTESGANSNNISFNNVASTGIGIDLLSNSNTLKSGTIGPNSGAGVHIGSGNTGNNVSGRTIQQNNNNGVFVEGNSNTITSNKLNTNSPAGVKVTGGSNTISSNQSDQNNGKGYDIGGSGTTFTGNSGQKNTSDAIVLSGTGQKVTSNAPQNTVSGLFAWRIVGTPATVVSSAGSNKANGSNIPTASKCANYFTNTGAATCN
jgi:hypothetical protein